MAKVLTPSLQVKKTTVIRKTRELSLSGELLVAIGDQVQADSAVARAELPGDLVILRISEQLGIDPESVISALKVAVGDTVTEKQLLCEHVGLFGIFKNRFFSPFGGVIEFITERTGHIGLRLPSQRIELNAFVPGSVVAIESGKSVTIETRGALIQGIFGVGGEKHGRIKSLAVENQRPLKAADVPEDCEGCILFGGCNPDVTALERAVERGATGLITGSIDDKALKKYLGYDLGIALTGNEKLPMTLIVTEGFGELAISERVAGLLGKLEGQLASINGATQVRAGAIRPEILVPHDLNFPADDHEQSPAELKEGSSVRIVRAPYFGELATVTGLPVATERIETGAKVRVVNLNLNGKQVTVPRANIELLA